MNNTASILALFFCSIAIPNIALADVVLSDFISLVQDVDPGANTIQTGYTPTSGPNSVLFVTLSFDNVGDPADSATFGGIALTKVDTGANRIFYLTDPGTAPGDIVLNLGAASDGGGNELVTVGTLLDVDFSSITALTGATASGSILSGSTFTDLDAGSFVLSQLGANNHTGTFSPVAGNPILASIDGGSGNYDGAVTGAVVSGGFTPSVDGFNNSNFLSGISVAFGTSNVPEPGSLGVLGLLMSAAMVTRRRKR